MTVWSPENDCSSHQPVLAVPFHRRPASLNYGFSGETTDLKACSTAIRRGSRSFHLAAQLLPSRTRQAAFSLYAFCRHSDDLIDGAGAEKSALASLRQRLNLIYQGRPAPLACDRAFARTVQEYAIPKLVAETLLDGFEMDTAGRRFQTIAEVKDYANCVAATVGIMMALVMKTGEPEALARAADLGLAMQLTNIARDVGEDVRNGRLYLPQDWLRDVGISPEELMLDPQFSPALGNVVARLLEEADHHYRLGLAGISFLPPDCRHAIRTAALVYQGIGTRIRENGYDSISQRASTALSTKLRLALSARRETESEKSVAPEFAAQPPDAATAALVMRSAHSYAAARKQSLSLPVLENATGRVDRFALILMQLQERAREENRFRRRLVQRKVTGLG